MSNQVLVVHPMAIAIPEFADIWNADNTTTKDNAVKELSFVYFMCNYKSAYRGYPESERMFKLKMDLWNDMNWSMPERVAKAMVKYEELQIASSSSMSLLKSAQRAALKIQDFMNTVNLINDDKGTKMGTLLKTLSSISNITRELGLLEQKVSQDLETTGRARGGGQIGARELPREKRKKD